MSSRGGYGGRGGGGGRRSDQSSGPVSWPALQSSGARGGRGRGNAGRGNAPVASSSSSSPRSDAAVSVAVGAADVDSSSSTAVSVRENPKVVSGSDSGASLGRELAEKVQITPETTVPPPSSSKAVKFPVRPGFGQAGKKVTIRANHFLVQVADRDLYHYDVRPPLESLLFLCVFTIRRRIVCLWLRFFGFYLGIIV